MAIANGKCPEEMPRKERTCAACDHSHRISPIELRCWLNPPQPCMIGFQPPALAGQLPRPIIIGVMPTTFPDYSCKYWEPRQPDHPDLAIAVDNAKDMELIGLDELKARSEDTVQ